MANTTTASTAPKNGQAQNGNGSTPPSPANGATPAVLERTIADGVLNKIKVFEETGAISIPPNFSVANALRAAWLIILETKNMNKEPALQVCTKESVANALLKMCVWGLNPLKNQCAFVVYGNQLTCQKEYAGTILIAKRDAGVEDVTAFAVFKDDVFEYVIDPKTKKKTVTKHEQTIDSMNTNQVKAAYAIVTYKDGSVETEIMGITQIQAAWRMGPTKGESPAHKNFPDQMAIKTVINRAVKIDINSSDDGSFFSSPSPDDRKIADVKYQIEDKANKKEISMQTEDAVLVDETKVDQETGEIKESASEERSEEEAPAQNVDSKGQTKLRGF